MITHWLTIKLPREKIQVALMIEEEKFVLLYYEIAGLSSQVKLSIL